ncbi:hypothetical protein M885DRAFT_507355 [Pelagophyceae sp. CCMP2097]|nr:hypothetical protein M885DRAFT_507355 [Pelagophyceae sp. CCMP2097]
MAAALLCVAAAVHVSAAYVSSPRLARQMRPRSDVAAFKERGGGGGYDQPPPPPPQDDRARQERREAIMAASDRAAARINAMKSGERPPEYDSPAEQRAPPPPQQRAPEPEYEEREYDEREYQESEYRQPMDIPKRQFSEPPKGYRPYYNSGEGYLSDLTSDSSKRHWSLGGKGETDDVEKQFVFGSRPDDQYREWDGDFLDDVMAGKPEPEKPGSKAAAPIGSYAAAVKAAAAAKRGAPATNAAPVNEASFVPAQRAAPSPVAAAKPPPPPTPPPAPAAYAPPPPRAPPAAPAAAPAPVAPAPVSAAAVEEEPAIPTSRPVDTRPVDDRTVLARAMAGLVQYVQAVQSGDNTMPGNMLLGTIESAREVLIRETLAAGPAIAAAAAPAQAPAPPAARAPPPPPTPPPVAAKPPPPAYAPPAYAAAPAAARPVAAMPAAPLAAAKPKMITAALETLDARDVAHLISSISPAFDLYGSKITELAIDGVFLASLAADELEETLVDLGVENRLQRRRILFELGLLHRK